MGKLREVIVAEELTADKIRQLAPHGLIGVRMEPEETRVYVRNSVGIYLPTENCFPLMDALESVGCEIYYGRKVPPSRGTALIKRRDDLKIITTLLNAYGGSEVDMVYVDKDLVPTIRTVIPMRSSIDFRNCFEAQCQFRKELRTFNKAGVVKILAVRNVIAA